MEPLSIVILAAGLGTRMKSALPKPLHEIGGKPMLSHVIETAKELLPNKLIVVYGHEGDKLKEAYKDDQSLTWVEQKTFEGTGDAVRYALPELDDPSKVLILYADTPLIDVETLKEVVDACDEKTLAWLTVNADQPKGYGRIIRDENNQMIAIIEENEANLDEKNITEVNSGIFAAPSKFLHTVIPQIKNNNSKSEYYLTDVVNFTKTMNMKIHTIHGDFALIRGVNNRVQLAELESIYQHKERERLMLDGITMINPETVFIQGNITITGSDIVIEPNVMLSGDVSLGNNVRIGMGSTIRNSTIHDDVEVLPYSLIESAELFNHVAVGPFTRIRPGTTLLEGSKVGNFVETKNMTLGKGSKANHLSYLGDAQIGSDVNIGAGTITCNYDGAKKHQTIIKNSVFVGSNSSLVAPIVIEENATIGAGSTITADVPNNKLVISRAPMRVVNQWTRPHKE